MAMVKAVCMAALLARCWSWEEEDEHTNTKCARIPNAKLPGLPDWHLSTKNTVENCTMECHARACGSFFWDKKHHSCDLHSVSAADMGDFNLSDPSASKRGPGSLKTFPGNPYDHYECDSIAWDLACHAKTKYDRTSFHRFACDSGKSLKIYVIPNAAIPGHNKKRLRKQTLVSCAAACFKQSWCKSFDWHKRTDACDLSDKSASDVGGLKHDYSGNPYDHFALVGSKFVEEYRNQHFMGKKYQDQQIMERIMERAPVMSTFFFHALMGSISLGGIAMSFIVFRRARKQAGHGDDAIMAQTGGTTSAEE
jgi:hypothetical protein